LLLYSLTISAPPLIRSLRNNMIGAKGASSLAAVLKETKITELQCAAAPECSLSCQRPLTLPTIPAPPSVHSLQSNHLGPKGGAALVDGLKGNSTLQVLK
jgi:hypothetical protein